MAVYNPSVVLCSFTDPGHPSLGFYLKDREFDSKETLTPLPPLPTDVVDRFANFTGAVNGILCVDFATPAAKEIYSLCNITNSSFLMVSSIQLTSDDGKVLSAFGANSSTERTWVSYDVSINMVGDQFFLGEVDGLVGIITWTSGSLEITRHYNLFVKRNSSNGTAIFRWVKGVKDVPTFLNFLTYRNNKFVFHCDNHFQVDVNKGVCYKDVFSFPGGELCHMVKIAVHKPHNSITPFREDLRVKARVVRLWSVPKNCSNNSPPSNRLEMILCDSQNNKICASINAIFERRFKRLFNEGEVIILSLVAVAHNNGTFRMTNHQYRIIFQYRTKVHKSSDDVPIQYFGFDFVNLRSIRCGVVDSTLLIGLVRNTSNIRRKFFDNFQTNRIPIEIYDACGNVLQVVFCGIHCQIFRTFIRNFSGGRIIVAIQWCKVADFHGSKYVTTSIEATRLLINEDITHFDDLPVEFQQLELKPDNFRNIHLARVSFELSKEPFVDFQLNTISELYISSEYSVHFILATVIKVNTSTDWYYYACDFCMEELDLEDDFYHCYSSGKSISSPSIRYKINVEVVDTTGWARLIILDPDASNFLMTDASKLLCRELTDDPLKHTNVLENLVHKVFLFKIFVNEPSCVPTPSFEVITMSWDASLIEKLSDKVIPLSDIESDDKSQNESSPTSPVFTSANHLTRPQNDWAT
ncbi:replication factor-A carboxy-terminal domain protein [Senna tora]|uniref:Replication factor-A carboxy-terminal domain protein n=1 Tax=Senna tora TaxID=362788 RepID=A0A834SZZ8_9FABA|nr:replication factor-A carboxy-terminal domain protein [Senna tora]